MQSITYRALPPYPAAGAAARRRRAKSILIVWCSWLPRDSAIPDIAIPSRRRWRDILASIGLQTAPAVLGACGFLDGLMIQEGVLLIDEARLPYPGDILHEAGHLAVVSGEKRKRLDGNVGGDPGEEMAAIAWSYAAALHIGIELAVVFHSGGYRGGSQASCGAFFLQVAPYPHMLKWLRE